MKTAFLKGTALDWAVAQAEGNVRLQYDSREGLIINNVLGWIPYRPSVAWQQGGPIIERELLEIGRQHGEWIACSEVADDGNWDENVCYGRTPLIAAMRCYVASKLGDEVEIPEELK